MGLLTVKDEAERSRAMAFTPLTGELSDSLRQCMGEDVHEGIERGGGVENLRDRRGDLLFCRSLPHGPWLAAKKSSRDLGDQKRCRGVEMERERREINKYIATLFSLKQEAWRIYSENSFQNDFTESRESLWSPGV